MLEYTLSWKPQPTPADIIKLTAPWTGILSDSSQKQSAQFNILWLQNTSIYGNTVHVLLRIDLFNPVLFEVRLGSSLMRAIGWL